MNTGFNWIKDLVPGLDVSPQEYMDAMTLTGTKVEGYAAPGEDLSNIVVGEILSIEKHPDADKLIVCQVNIGEKDAIQIVTGAPNVSVGDKIPVVLDGGRVVCDHDGNRVEGGLEIKKGKLRGLLSNGMMCSIQELGSNTDMYPEAPENGIYIFAKDAPVGADAAELLGLKNVTFEYEITSNRVDCFGVLGIAREAAATFQKEFVPPEIKETGDQRKVSDYLSVEVKNTTLCKRYIARVVTDIKIAPSPVWMQRRLAAQGIRPINNIVDITNYVMEEFGQPMHAYDLATISGKKIIVDCASNGQEFTTLDGQKRLLTDQCLMICDGEKPIGIAGIMGGENSMITDSVQTICFEAACFDGTNIRLSSKKVGLRTDASGKFEKGLDPNQAMLAMNRACQLMEELGAGKVVGGCIDSYPEPVNGNTVELDYQAINALLGTSITKEEMIAYLSKIQLKYCENNNLIEVPSWRQDIHCMADVAEEIARFYGYDKIDITLPKGETTMGGIGFKLQLEKLATTVARYNGFSQAMSYSFESPKVFDKLMLDENAPQRKAITISNPLGEDFSIMRTVPVHGILTSLAINSNRRNKDVRLFELGNIYLPKALPVTELPEERMELTLGMYGQGDFYEMKGVVEEIISECGVKGRLTFSPTGDYSYLHPGRTADIYKGERKLGYLGELHPKVQENYGIKDKVLLAVIDMPALYDYADFLNKYQGIAKYPAVNRDISMVVPKNILAGTIEDVIRENGGSNLEQLSLFDIYEGDQIQKGFKSMAYSVSFRSSEKTLEEQDITPIMNKIYTGLEEIGISLRQ